MNSNTKGMTLNSEKVEAFREAAIQPLRSPSSEEELDNAKREANGALETVSTSYNMDLLAARMKEAVYAFENNAKLTTVTHLEEMEKIINRVKGILILENRTNNL